jgi:hypothetical protein
MNSNSLQPILLPPDPLVPPASIRKYFAALLTQKYNISQDTAIKLVKYWQYGIGIEIRSFSINTYREILGPELDALLYQYQFLRPIDRLAYHLSPNSDTILGGKKQ